MTMLDLSRKHDRAAELRAIADGRLMLNVRNGVTVARSMLARIADEFEAMSTALAAKDAELAAVRVSNNKWLAKWERAEAQLAEANKALNLIAEGRPDNPIGDPWAFYDDLVAVARRAREAQGRE